MWGGAATENYELWSTLYPGWLEGQHMLLDNVRDGDVVQLNPPTAGQTSYVFVYSLSDRGGRSELQLWPGGGFGCATVVSEA